MSKVYRRQVDGLTVLSGITKEVSLDKQTIIVTAEIYNRDTKQNDSVDMTVKAPAPVEDVKVGDLVTAVGYGAGINVINAMTISSENNYIALNAPNEKDSVGVLSGRVLFANYRDELDADGQPRLKASGAPKKPHFDITLATGSGSERVTHTVKIYDFKDSPNIKRAKKLFNNFDRTENPIYVSIVTTIGNAYTTQKEKDGQVYTNNNMSHLGYRSLDLTYINSLEKKKNTPVAEQPAKAESEVQTPAAEANVASSVPSTPETIAEATPNFEVPNFDIDAIDSLEDLDNIDLEI